MKQGLSDLCRETREERYGVRVSLPVGPANTLYQLRFDTSHAPGNAQPGLGDIQRMGEKKGLETREVGRRVQAGTRRVSSLG